ncbi:hypothetical protein PACILC2_22740 [Paenibacillus cisolokensis]|uniref:Uncharacterized protein n=1 Tax=Paenibacillus cisolokensis TaxID=1658519 RepID=A0ABQ4N721_9BACL|nr:hypothetical protein [Paenibacillus cisolokensis]GIQ63706.1 hypothetical protein PACILC2_22740 [Paenibacillus cisolokensis]
MNKAIAKYPFSGTGDYSVEFPDTMSSLVLFNDGSTDITFSTDHFTHTLKPGDVFDEWLANFTSLKITSAGGQFRGYCRSGGG